MARFQDLTVTGLRKTIRDAVEVTLAPADPEAFEFIQGQYLTFRQEIEGEEIRRSYSICAGLDDGVLQVGIKRVDGGAFSTWANEVLSVGDVVSAMPPMGGFHAPLTPDRAKRYVGFAGGSGITPVLSIIRTVLAREPKARFTLIYANRGVNTIMFREEIEDLKNLHLGRFNVIHVLEQDAQEIDLFTGMVTEEKCGELIRSGWVGVEGLDMAFICGPEPMMLGIAAALKTAGVPEERIKFELFVSAQPGRLKRKAVSIADGSGGGETEVAVTLDGSTQTIRFGKDTSILEGALASSLDVPFACKAGVCSTCRCRLIDGEVEMVTNHALEDDEVAKGYRLSCQSYPLTDRVVVTYDE